MDDYTDLILGRNQPKAEGGKFNKKGDRKAAAQAREKAQEMRKRARDAEAELERLTAERRAVDQAMAEPGSAEPRYAKMTMTELMKRSAEIAAALEQAEAAWLTASEALEPLEAAL
jgi:ATP-binding cassette subfamily F protein 3